MVSASLLVQVTHTHTRTPRLQLMADGLSPSSVPAPAPAPQVIAIPMLGPRLMDSDLGQALHRFVRIASIEWDATWGVGAWMVLAAAVCDTIGMWLY